MTAAALLPLVVGALVALGGEGSRPRYDDIAAAIDGGLRPADAILEVTLARAGSPVRDQLTGELREPGRVSFDAADPALWRRVAKRGGRVWLVLPEPLSALAAGPIERVASGAGFRRLRRRRYAGLVDTWLVVYAPGALRRAPAPAPPVPQR